VYERLVHDAEVMAAQVARGTWAYIGTYMARGHAPSPRISR